MVATVLDRSCNHDRVEQVSLQAPAKVNLSLVIRGKREDGFHDLHTVVAALTLHDDLQISQSSTGGIALECSGRTIPADDDNLVIRAAKLLARRMGITPAIRIKLHKRIPCGAGLGGGSSDAAYCLMGLNRLWQLGLDRQQLAEIGAELGSDVPFFLHGPVSLCTGRGERVSALPHRCRRSMVLIVTGVHVPTVQVYQRHRCQDQLVERQMRQVRYFLRVGDLDGLMIRGINSLASTCLDLFAPLQDLHRRIDRMGLGPVCVAGSGSCLFVSADSRERAGYVAKRLGQEGIGETLVVDFEPDVETIQERQHGNY